MCVSVDVCTCVMATRLEYDILLLVLFECLFGLNTGLEEEEEEVCNICLSV